VERRSRLSRSRDFDAVYRQGRSVSSRTLTLHWFARPDEDGQPRVGFAVPKAVGPAVARNRVKRAMREAWRSLESEIPTGRDYVLAARAGLAEPLASRGSAWLLEQVRAILRQASP
jgi:ribonuclease P protein component